MAERRKFSINVEMHLMCCTEAIRVSFKNLRFVGDFLDTSCR